MKLIGSFAIAAGALLAAGASVANPPAGVFTAVDPIAPRYPVTLDIKGPVAGSPCESHRELVLKDATGATVMAPFVVPMFQKFVVTDVSWIAKPYDVPFDPEGTVNVGIRSIFPGSLLNGFHTFMQSDRVTAKMATGARSFVSGPTYVAGTTLCLYAGQWIPGGSSTAQLDAARVHGYLMDDDAK